MLILAITQTFIGRDDSNLQGTFDVLDNKDFFYDCIKTVYKNQEEVFDFHFEHVEKRKYKVRVPRCDDDVSNFSKQFLFNSVDNCFVVISVLSRVR